MMPSESLILGKKACKPRPSGMERNAQKYRSESINYGGAGSGFAGHSRFIKGRWDIIKPSRWKK